ncbi:GMP synthase [Streptococcus pneumoniae]|nr:GMP synthase [Streptococcus pneumoniae]
MRDANRGGCSQSCRWKYDLYDMPFGKERKSLQGEIPEEFSMSAVDMSMIDHIPDMIENGVDSLKIEGRMESIHYVLTVTNCYKAAVDAYLESPEKFEAIKQDLVDEMWKVAQRELATGFYYGTPSENEQLFGARRKIPEYKFVAEVVSYDDAAQTATIRQRNVINEGDQVEFYGPGFRHFETYIEDLHDAKGNKIDRAPNPMELLTIKVPQPVQSGDMVRALKEGLINLYKEDGTSVTVRDQLICIFVDHGLLRKGEADQVMDMLGGKFGLNIVKADTAKRFLDKLAGVSDPEQKRKIIGNEFVYVFDDEASKLKDVKFLAQGTLYTDVIESGTDTAQTIKSHHNVGGLPEDMQFELIEPLNTLYKDEVRALGTELGMPDHIVWRQPFPGPGLAIRVMGEITEEKLETVRESDAILREEIAKAGLDRDIWQYFTVNTGVRSVGVMGDGRTYDYTIAIRAITSIDGMTADFAKIPWEVLQKISVRIVNEVDHVNRIVYDITSKPPATVEWE